MVLDLIPLFSGEVNSAAVSFDFDLNGCSDDIVSGSSKVDVVCKNNSGYTQLSANFDMSFKGICACCAKEFDGVMRFNTIFPLANHPMPDNDEYLVVENGQLDLDEFCRMVTNLRMPMKILCKPDCKGLCPKCGADLNGQSCGCTLKEPDPRLAKLKDYFKND